MLLFNPGTSLNESLVIEESVIKIELLVFDMGIDKDGGNRLCGHIMTVNKSNILKCVTRYHLEISIFSFQDIETRWQQDGKRAFIDLVK